MSTPALSAKAASHGARLPSGLYAICDDAVRPQVPLRDKAAFLLSAGIRVIQLRMKLTLSASALGLAREIAARCRQYGALCLINDRVDYALMSGSDGVHLGAEDMPVDEARKLLGTAGIIGATVRGAEGIVAAQEAGADYVGLGPVFDSTSKIGHAPALGIANLRQIVARSPLPVIAISGINLSNIELVASTGVHGVAILSDLLNADDVVTRAHALAQAFDRGRLR